MDWDSSASGSSGNMLSTRPLQASVSHETEGNGLSYSHCKVTDLNSLLYKSIPHMEDIKSFWPLPPKCW